MTSLQGYHHAVDALISLADLTGVDLATGTTEIARYGTRGHFAVRVHDLTAADFDAAAEYIDAECHDISAEYGGDLMSANGNWGDVDWTLFTHDVAPCVACGEPTTHVDDERGRLCTPHLAAAARAHDEHVEATP
jgi:hypothetical protein